MSSRGDMHALIHSAIGEARVVTMGHPSHGETQPEFLKTQTRQEMSNTCKVSRELPTDHVQHRVQYRADSRLSSTSQHLVL